MNATTAQSVLHYLKQHGTIDRSTRLYVASAMRKCRRIIAAAAVATLAACGGGGDSGATCATVHVQMFGDSIGNRYAAGLQAVADQERGKGAVFVEDRSGSGTTSQMLIDGTDGKNEPWPAGVGADVVFVNHGTNDRTLNVPLDVYASNLRAFQAGGALVIVPPPKTTMNYTPAYADAARALPNVIDAHALIVAMPNWQAHFPDQTHPDAELSKKVARELLLPLVPMCGGAK